MGSVRLRFRLEVTTSASDAQSRVVAAVREGARHFAVAGGDGTAHGVLNALCSQPDVPIDEFTLAVLPLGTGNDWARSLGVPLALEAAVRVLANGRTCRHDVGVVSRAADGRPQRRYFINMAGAGFDAHVVRVAHARGQSLGRWRYANALVRSVRSFDAPVLTVTAPDFAYEGRALVAFAQIGRYLAGGMRIARDASRDDGFFDVTVIDAMPAVAVLAQLPRLFYGDLTRSRWVTTTRVAEFEIGGDAELQADGELIGRLPASLEVLPRALTVIVGAQSANQV